MSGAVGEEVRVRDEAVDEGTAAFRALVREATGVAPYPYQERLAAEGPSDVLEVPTGGGKTLAAVLPWLFRRRLHPDPRVRRATPRRLVLVLPMRVLVEQTADTVGGWLTALRDAGRLGHDAAMDDVTVDDVTVTVLMGGEPRDDDWRRHPECDAVLVGTLDMLLSRALNRGYAASRFAWPVDFGLLNADCHWVLDEVQLMGPALPTSRQLQAFRDRLGTAARCTSTWMSATVDPAALTTVDNPDLGRVLTPAEDDMTGPLGRRLRAGKRVERVDVPAGGSRYARGVADALLAHHRPGTRTIAVLNTVERAQEVHTALQRAVGKAGGNAAEARIVLLHSRFRPGDRRRLVDAALAEPPPAGTIVVATQVIEAGVDVTAATLLTEAASWASVVQRAGRCNRYGETRDAALLWVRPPRPEPYDEADVADAVDALTRLEGGEVTPASMPGLVAPRPRLHPVLRRRDLLQLFDTTPDLSGDDVDVSRYLREDGVDVAVAWRDLGGGRPAGDAPAPVRDELCPVPVARLRGALRDGFAQGRAWRFDHLDAAWAPVGDRDVRPGQVLLLDVAAGGYVPDRGFDPGVDGPVVPVTTPEAGDDAGERSDTPSVEAVGGDPTSVRGARGGWVPLGEHLDDVAAEVRRLADVLGWDGLDPADVEAAVAAGRWHDLGKTALVYQEALDGAEGAPRPDDGGPWAKAPRLRRYRRAHFRHELVSALALLGPAAHLLDGLAERDLAVYLAAAHHGKVRIGIRSLPDEDPPPDDAGRADRRVALGVVDGEPYGPVTLPGADVPEGVLDLSVMDLGGPGGTGSGTGADGAPSWTAQALTLLERLGPFRLAALEALVRVADWRASAAAEPTPESGPEPHERRRR